MNIQSLTRCNTKLLFKRNNILLINKRNYQLQSILNNKNCNSILTDSLNYNINSIQFKILEHTILKNLPIYGFNNNAIINSIIDLKLNDNYNINNLLNMISLNSNSTVFELIKFNYIYKRYLTFKNITTNDNTSNLQDLFLYRIDLDSNISDKLKNTLNLNYLIKLNSEFLNFSNDLIYYSNNIKDSHSINWYFKRLLLTKIFINSQIYLANTNDILSTKKFIKSQLSLENKISNTADNISEFTDFAFSTGLNLLKSKTFTGGAK